MKTVLITGANGFIGRHLVRCLAGPFEVLALDNRAPDVASVGHVRWIVHDLAMPLPLATAAPIERLDAIVHLAQSAEYRNFPEKAADIFKVNVLGTFQILEYARLIGVKAFILASTGTLYSPGCEPLLESARIEPNGFYARTKYASELLLAEYQRFFVGVTLRLFTVYGPGQKNAMIPNLIEKVRGGEEIVIDGNPGLRINPIHVRDVVRVIAAALALQQSTVMNVAGDEPVSVTDIVRVIEQTMRRTALVRYVENSRDGDLVGRNDRMKESLRISTEVSLREGIGSLVEISE